MKIVGKQIRKYRNEKGYTQEQLGKLLGVSTQAVSNMYSRMNTPVTTAVISSKTDIPEEELEDCMETLCRSNLATRIVITTLDGEINAYKYRQESSVIPLLCIADEITRTNILLRFYRNLPPHKTVAIKLNSYLNHQTTVELCKNKVACIHFSLTV